MINITIIKSFFLKFVRELCNNFHLYFTVCALGVMCAMWPDFLGNETINNLTVFSLFVSIIALFISNYFIVENAIESRNKNKKKLFSEYCARFSSNQNICRVAEWLLSIAEFDPNGFLINVYPKDRGKKITEPTYYEKTCFVDFFIELNIQINNEQLEKEDVRKYFSPYVLIFKRVLQAENKEFCYMRNLADLSEIL